MNTVRSDFEKRNLINKKFIEHIKKTSEVHGNIEVVNILKSSFYIALYNNVEATVYSILEHIHDRLSSHGYDELNDILKKKLATYYLAGCNDKNIDAIKVVSISDRIISGREKFPQFCCFIKIQRVFSGNIDARVIRNIFKSYGVNLSNLKGDTRHLLDVTSKRNKIAHGEISLSKADNVKLSSLQNTMASVDAILNEVISVTEVYLNEKKYLSRKL